MKNYSNQNYGNESIPPSVANPRVRPVSDAAINGDPAPVVRRVRAKPKPVDMMNPPDGVGAQMDAQKRAAVKRAALDAKHKAVTSKAVAARAGVVKRAGVAPERTAEVVQRAFKQSAPTTKRYDT